MNEFRRTKIVATLGPASESPEVIDSLVAAGVNVVRLNFSHGTAEEHRLRAERVREAAARHKVCVGILADMQGPKIRCGRFKQGRTLLETGQSFILDADLDLADGDDERVGLTYKGLVEDVAPGDRLLLNDGLIVMDVVEVRGHEIHCRVVVGGELSNNKGINRAGGGLSAAALTDKDKADIKAACAIGVDYIAISFPSNGADMKLARALVEAEGSQANLVAKVERAEAVIEQNLRSILAATDAVMIARGDLGVEIGDAAVPPVQKKILAMAAEYNCPVIVATQMMESMVNNPIPTRAEVNDVANAVNEGTDAIMLSGETAAGRYPVEAVEAMHRTCLETERQPFVSIISCKNEEEENSLQSTDACIARLAMETTHRMPIRAIAAFTQSGNTALYMSRHLSRVPIYALTPLGTTAGRVTLYRNVIPKPIPDDYGPNDAQRATRDAFGVMLYDKLISENDLVVMTFGTPMGTAGSTNTLKIVQAARIFGS